MEIDFITLKPETESLGNYTIMTDCIRKTLETVSHFEKVSDSETLGQRKKQKKNLNHFSVFEIT